MKPAGSQVRRAFALMFDCPQTLHLPKVRRPAPSFFSPFFGNNLTKNGVVHNNFIYYCNYTSFPNKLPPGIT